MCIVVIMCVPVFIVMPVSVHCVESVDDTARTEEEQCLEKSVCCEVKESSDVTAYANPKHHISELADRGVCQDPLDVKADDSDGCGDECGNTADIGNDQR